MIDPSSVGILAQAVCLVIQRCRLLVSTPVTFRPCAFGRAPSAVRLLPRAMAGQRSSEISARVWSACGLGDSSSDDERVPQAPLQRLAPEIAGSVSVSTSAGHVGEGDVQQPERESPDDGCGPLPVIEPFASAAYSLVVVGRSSPRNEFAPCVEECRLERANSEAIVSTSSRSGPASPSSKAPALAAVDMGRCPPLLQAAAPTSLDGGMLMDLMVFGHSSVLAAPWWHYVVSPGMRARVAASGDIYWRLPEQESDESGMLEHAHFQVRRCSSSNRQFYIGITERPDERWEAHARGGYSTMWIVACAASSSVTARLERCLIYAHRGNLHCANVGGGGERASAGSPHFVYVTFRSDGLLRRAGGGGGGSTGRGRFRMPSVEEDLRYFSPY